MWKLFQIAVFAAVAVSNIIYQWTPNPLAVSFFGFCAAYAATVFLSWLIDLARRGKALLL